MATASNSKVALSHMCCLIFFTYETKIIITVIMASTNSDCFMVVRRCRSVSDKRVSYLTTESKQPPVNKQQQLGACSLLWAPLTNKKVQSAT